MEKRRSRLWLASALLVLSLVGEAAARRPWAVRVECSSLSGRYSYCPTYAIGSVRLERQLSKARCRQFETWGSSGDGSGIWVRNGCRATFIVSRGGVLGPGPRPRTITCTSRDYGYARCDVPTWGRQVYVKRQLSNTRWVQGRNWGADWGGIWVDRGCNAEFAID
jgi:hypothetical protein